MTAAFLFLVELTQISLVRREKIRHPGAVITGRSFEFQRRLRQRRQLFAQFEDILVPVAHSVDKVRMTIYDLFSSFMPP